eukprot:15409706-Heterocapsa_arctica.AAC.1
MLSIVVRLPRRRLSDCHVHQAVHGSAIHTSECRWAFALASSSWPSARTLSRRDMSWSGSPGRVASILWRLHQFDKTESLPQQYS